MNTLIMKFKNRAGKNVSFRIAKVKEGLTKDESMTLMDLLITKNIFFLGEKELVEKVSCEIASTKVLA